MRLIGQRQTGVLGHGSGYHHWNPLLSGGKGGGRSLPHLDGDQHGLNRALIGFVIGISALRWHWAGHGIFWGLLISLLMAIPALGMDSVRGFFMVLVFGAIWGFLIELFTSKVFKAPAAKASPA